MKTVFGAGRSWAFLGCVVLAGCGGSGNDDSPAPAVSVADSAACAAAVAVAQGSSTTPGGLCVPTLAYDDTTISLVWQKPANYANVVDYRVYQDGKLLGLASANNTTHSPAKPYIDQFYKDDTAGFHAKVQFHNFLVSGLSPNTQYRFTVRAVMKDGSESADSNVVLQTTAPKYAKVVDVSGLTTLGDITDAVAITANTTAIQKVIDDCAAGSTSAYGCKILFPSGKVIVTGALFLQSNMTLEIAEGGTLKGSPNTADYPLSKGYQLYSYETNVTDDRRPPSLLNLLNPKHMNGTRAERTGYDETRGVFTNVRVTGKGLLDCNGWNRLASDVIDEGGTSLPQYAAGSGGTIAGFSTGILAKSQMEAALAEYGISSANETAKKSDISNLYSNRRSSVTTFRGVKNMYFGGLTIRNPAYHGVMFIESDNVVFANTVNQTFDVNNGDGVEFGNTNGGWVYNNFFDTGDDNVNFAAGQGKDYESSVPSANVWVFNNYMREGHGVLALGSHTGGWIQDILAEDNVAYLTDNGLRMKSTPATGGGARRITFRDNAMRSVGARTAVSTAGGKTFTDGGGNGNAFIFTLSYSAGSNVFPNASASAQFRDILVKNVTLDNVDATKGGVSIQVDAYAGTDATLGYPETFHENLVFEAVKIKDAKATSISRLKGSTFKDVTVTVGGTTPATTWWVFKDTNPGNSYTNVSPVPAN